MTKQQAEALIDQERNEQKEKHRFTPEHDAVQNCQCQLSQAADAIYFSSRRRWPRGWQMAVQNHILMKPRKDQLVVAGALYKAELDRVKGMIGQSDAPDKSGFIKESYAETLRVQVNNVIHDLMWIDQPKGMP